VHFILPPQLCVIDTTPRSFSSTFLHISAAPTTHELAMPEKMGPSLLETKFTLWCWGHLSPCKNWQVHLNLRMRTSHTPRAATPPPLRWGRAGPVVQNHDVVVGPLFLALCGSKRHRVFSLGLHQPNRGQRWPRMPQEWFYFTLQEPHLGFSTRPREFNSLCSL